jgi:hypothetical protein
VDIEEMLAWGTEIDKATVLAWIDKLLGADSAQHAHLVEILEPEAR